MTCIIFIFSILSFSFFYTGGSLLCSFSSVFFPVTCGWSSVQLISNHKALILKALSILQNGGSICHGSVGLICCDGMRELTD